MAETDLGRANLTGANLSEANMTGCFIYGIAAWDVRLENTIQSNLVITRLKQHMITVDNLEVAQFIYLLLNNQKIRDVVDTIAKKAVLILGRFTPERRAILDAIRETLRQRDYLPILFDFDKLQSQDLTETVSTLAHLAKFVIADLTNPSSVPHEVMAIAPHCIVPIQPIFHPDDVTKYEYAMFRDLQQRYHWVLPTHHYQDLNDLLSSLQAKAIVPAEQKARELEKRRE